MTEIELNTELFPEKLWSSVRLHCYTT